MLTKQQYRALRSKLDRYNAAWNAFDPKRSARGGGYSPAEQKAIVKLAKLRREPTNAERSAVEVYEFKATPPDTYFLYVDEKTSTVTTWVGDVLGSVTFGREYKCGAFGGWPSKRQPVRVHAINGHTYYGTYYKSSGNYARVRRTKR